MDFDVLRGFARLLTVALLAGGCAASGGPASHASHESSPGRAVYVSRDSDSPLTRTGIASFYGREHHGRRTASGERFDMNAMTAAHPTLPFGTRVRVTHLANGRSVVVRINDHGPFRGGRILDVSQAAAARLRMVGAGKAKVKIEILGEVASED